MERISPGNVRDALLSVLSETQKPLSLVEIELAVRGVLGRVSSSSIRSYLNNNTPSAFERTQRGFYRLKRIDQALARRNDFDSFKRGKAELFRGDCIEWLDGQPHTSVHAVVTDPPYGLVEYQDQQLLKRSNGKGGVWRIPPSFDGAKRSALPRFTVLKPNELQDISDFFAKLGRHLMPVLVPGANVIVASQPLIFHNVVQAMASAGFEPRGVIIRLVTTMRGGDRPKNAHEEFSDVSVMPRSMWEPWILLRKPLEGRVQDNLRKWGTGGFRRISEEQPFGDVIKSRPTRPQEKTLAQHPSLKPQEFLRKIVRAVLPSNKGIVLDPFAGSGSTLAACNQVGVRSIGVEKNAQYFEMARSAISRLEKLA